MPFSLLEGLDEENKKVLNNNSIVTDVNNQEVVIIGKGIGFNKREGEIYDDSLADKLFVLSNAKTMNLFQQLMQSIPVEYFKVTNEIVHYAEEILNKKLSESIYVHLTDHINSAVDRMNKDMVVTNGLLWETKDIYRTEFEIGMEALNIIANQLGVLLPEDEAGFIALHIVNAELNEEMPKVQEMTKIIKEILLVVKYNFKISFNESSMAYSRFITHLKFFAQRLVQNKSYEVKEDNKLFELIQKNYVDSFKCALRIKKFIEDKYTFSISNDELIYLTIHIERVVDNSK